MFQIRMDKYLLRNTGKRSLKVPGRMERRAGRKRTLAETGIMEEM